MRKPKDLYYNQHAEYRRKKHFQLTDEYLPHKRFYPPKTLYNVRRLLRNYYNYSVVHPI